MIIKWFKKTVANYKERNLRLEHLRELYWNSLCKPRNMLCLVDHKIVITGNGYEEACAKAAPIVKKLRTLPEEAHLSDYDPYIKYLHSLDGTPKIEVKQHEDGNESKTEIIISYLQNELKPGFSEEEFRVAASKYDAANMEFLQYRDECVRLGIIDQ